MARAKDHTLPDERVARRRKLVDVAVGCLHAAQKGCFSDSYACDAKLSIFDNPAQYRYVLWQDA
jgi:hypothetical protein